MTSQLNVDTIVDKAGSGGTNVKIGNTSTYVSENSTTTQNTVQGLGKSWCNYVTASTFVNNDSFNVSSLGDFGAGSCTMNFTNNMNNVTFSSPAISSNTHIFQGGTSTSNVSNVSRDNNHADSDAARNHNTVHGDLA